VRGRSCGRNKLSSTSPPRLLSCPPLARHPNQFQRPSWTPGKARNTVHVCVCSNSPVWQMRVATNVVPPWLCGPSRGVFPQNVDGSFFLFRPICRKERLNSSLGNFPTQSKRDHFQSCRERYRRYRRNLVARVGRSKNWNDGIGR
jgi:hypothetical protein